MVLTLGVGAGLEVPVLGSVWPHWGLTWPCRAPSSSWNCNFGMSREQPWAEQRGCRCLELFKWFLFESGLIHRISPPGISSLLDAQTDFPPLPLPKTLLVGTELLPALRCLVWEGFSPSSPFQVPAFPSGKEPGIPVSSACLTGRGKGRW